MNGIIAAAQGVLPRDPELRYLPSGQPVCNFSIAVNDAKKAEGAETEWVKVAAWGELAESLNNRLAKGTEVYVEGRVKLNTWQSQDGQQRAGISLSAWKVEPMGAIGRRGRPTEDDGRERIARAAGEGHQRAAARATGRPVPIARGQRWNSAEPADDDLPF